MGSYNEIKKIKVDVKPIYNKEHPILAAKAHFAKQNLAQIDEHENKVNPRKAREGSFKTITDLNYYMDGYLQSNLLEVKNFLKKGYDCVIIISGNGKVRLGKSTIASQVAYFIAWDILQDKIKRKLVPADTKVPFTNDNIVFDPETLMNKSSTYPRNSVFVYDEGRAGLDSARAMENINKATMDFFQECGQYGHVVLIVLPDFFKLSEMIAVPRSLFLINVYHDRNYNRGYFSFFNERQKELLYIIGKKKWGSTAKYMSVDDSFHGRFADFMPIDKTLYDQQKREALKKKQKSRTEVKWQRQRDALIWLMKQKTQMSDQKLAESVTRLSRIVISESSVKLAWNTVEKNLELGTMGEELPNPIEVEEESESK